MSEISDNPQFKSWVMIVCQGKKSITDVTDTAKEPGLIEAAKDSRDKELTLLTMCSQGNPDQVKTILQTDKTNH